MADIHLYISKYNCYIESLFTLQLSFPCIDQVFQPKEWFHATRIFYGWENMKNLNRYVKTPT